MRLERISSSLPVLLVCGAMCFGQTVARGKIVPHGPPANGVSAAIQTSNVHYLTVVNAGGFGGPDSGPFAAPLHTDATSAGDWEKFTIQWLDGAHTRFALLTMNGHYVTAVNGGGIGGPNDFTAPVHTDTTKIGPWERLILDFLPDSKVTVRTSTGHYLTALGGGGMGGPNTMPIHTDATKLGAWETFTLVPVERELEPRPDVGPGGSNAEATLQHLGGGMWNVHSTKAAFAPEKATQEMVADAALEFLDAHKDVWKMKNPRQELKLSRYTPGDGVTVVSDQWNGGLPVFDHDVLMHFDEGAHLNLVNLNYLSGLDGLRKTPGKSAAEIVAMLKESDANCPVGPLKMGGCQTSQPVLGVWAGEPDDANAPAPKLVYRLTIGWTGVIVDADSGTVLTRWKTILN
ncbi:MAG TPA: hypothetical protein VK670_17010 [Silvibacterium sp.]|nr:hypothetical protein [Silvibacterium sp.]